MAVGATDFLKLAEKLSSSAEEVEMRCSMSRAYYGLYHHCKTWFDALPIKSVGLGRGVHDKFIYQLDNPASGLDPSLMRHSKFLAAKLRVSKAQRVVADYKLTSHITSGQVATQLQHVKSVVPTN